MIEFAVEDILFEDVEAAAATSEAAARSGLILPSMTIDPADTKTPYSDATQVGMRDRMRAAGTARATIRTWPTAQTDRLRRYLSCTSPKFARGV